MTKKRPARREFLGAPLALWAERGPMHKLYDVLAAWRERASNVTGKPLPGGHFLAEEVPDETYAELRAFLRV